MPPTSISICFDFFEILNFVYGHLWGVGLQCFMVKFPLKRHYSNRTFSVEKSINGPCEANISGRKSICGPYRPNISGRKSMYRPAVSQLWEKVLTLGPSVNPSLPTSSTGASYFSLFSESIVY